MPNGGAQRLLTVGQAARRLGVHPTTLRSWADRGIVKVVRLPTGARRFDPEEVARVARAMGIEDRRDGEA